MILMPYGKAFFRLSLKLLRKHIPVARRGKSKVSHGKTLLLQGRRVKNGHRGCPTGWAASQTKMAPVWVQGPRATPISWLFQDARSCTWDAIDAYVPQLRPSLKSRVRCHANSPA